MRVAYKILIACLYAFVFAPIVIILILSFNSGKGISLPISGLSLRWYAAALTDRTFTGPLITSLWLAAGATAMALPPAILAALALSRKNFRGAAAVEVLLMAPLLVPTIVIGMGLLIYFSLIGLQNAPLRLLLAHWLIVFPYCTRTVLASLARMDRTLIEGARSLGATPLRAFLYVTLPMISPGIIAGALFGFIISFGDVPVSLFLANARTTTLPLTIMSSLEYQMDPSVIAMSALVIFGSFALALVGERLVGLHSLLGAKS
ncbi:putative spermidine/putrescine transport system permease protein [Nitrobacteraceae bacterium AZCC 2146]